MQKMRICIKNINDLSEKEYHENYLKLSKVQKSKIDKLKRLEDKKLSLLGLMITKKLYNCNYKDINYINGKPYIKDKYFSISHKEPYTIAITNNDTIGIDIEKIIDVDENTKKFLNAKNSFDSLIKWTKIESYYKYNNELVLNLEKIKTVKFITIVLEKKYIISICKKS